MDSGAVRALTERLVAIPSVSPDPAAEARCAGALLGALPPGLERGQWRTEDGRPIVWALARGGSPRTVLLLGHYDTVGVTDYDGLDPARGEAIAFDPDAVGSRLLERAGTLPEPVRADLGDEARRPGAWMFGRGALDMKSGLAAATAALAALVVEPPPGHVIFVATPDEEHESAGMLAAVPELARFRDARGLELVGALNLDYALEPSVHAGAVGKLEVGCFALGHAGHVGDPHRGLDAIQMIAAVVAAVTRAPELIEPEGLVPPAALAMRDLKTGYSIEAAHEAVAEFSVITHGRDLSATLAVLRAVATRALASMSPPGVPVPTVVTYSELIARMHTRPDAAAAPGPDARAATLERIREALRETAVAPPALVIHLLPPFYPFAAAGSGPLVRAARAVANAEGLAVRPLYPFISDMSYLAWRGREDELAREFPALGHEYRLPFAAMMALDLEVVNLGPWGRDAHTRYERVHAPFAFERLPRLIERVVRGALDPSST